MSNNGDPLLRKKVLVVDNMKKKYLYNKFASKVTANKDLFTTLTTYLSPSKYFNVFEPNKTIENRFGELQMLVINKDIIKEVNDIVNLYYKCVKRDQQVSFELNGKIMLFAWVIASFPEDIIGKKRELLSDPNNFPDDIYFFATDLIGKINSLSNNKTLFTNSEFVRKFIKNVNQYSNAFTYFKQRDKVKKIHEFVGQYNDVNETLKLVEASNKYTPEAKEESLKEIKKSKDKIFKCISAIDKSINRDELDFILKKEHIREKRLEETMYKILIDDISKKKFVYLPKVLDEIKESFNKLNGRAINLTNSEGSYLSIDDLLDSELIIKKITYMNFTRDDALMYGNHMKTIINGIESPEQEVETNIKWENLTQKLGDSSTIFASVLFFVLNEIREIKESILNFATLIQITSK